jgi:hypothetical protein
MWLGNFQETAFLHGVVPDWRMVHGFHLWNGPPEESMQRLVLLGKRFFGRNRNYGKCWLDAGYSAAADSAP